MFLPIDRKYFCNHKAHIIKNKQKKLQLFTAALPTFTTIKMELSFLHFRGLKNSVDVNAFCPLLNHVKY